MVDTYKSETHEVRVRGRCFSVVNLTPILSESENKATRKATEQQLYEVFRKYFSPNA